MFILERSRTVALLIDYDNLQICAQRDAPGSELDLRSVVALAQRFGTLVVARAYAEWNNPNERLEAYKAGIEPIFAPVLRTEGPAGRDGKSLADTVMVADGVDLMWTHAPDVFVLVTSDKDLIPLARLAKQRGARVVVLGSDLTAVPLRELADEFFTYRRLVHEVTGLVLGGGQPSGRAAGGERQTRQRPVRRERPAAPLSPPPIQAPEPLQEQPAQPEPTPLPLMQVNQEEHVAQVGPRRRRRRGGRSRGRNGQVTPPDQMSGETLVVADEISANGADHTVDEAQPSDVVETMPAAEEPLAFSTPEITEAPQPSAEEPSVEQLPDQGEPKPRRRRRRPSSSQA